MTLYDSIIKKAQDNGQIRKDIDPFYSAFFLENLFILLKFSYSCEYYKHSVLKCMLMKMYLIMLIYWLRSL